ncbi:MAG: SdpI family protein [Bacillota bacterium]
MPKITMKTEWRALLILAAAIGLSAWAYPQLPETVASHWNFQGNVDGWTNKTFHSLFFPGLLIFIYVLLLVTPYLDPRKERYAEFTGVYQLIRDSILFVMASVFAIATFFNLGYDINVGKTVAFLIGLLFIVLGNYFGKIKRNWFVGIKTPWTLSSENIWNKTHRLGGRLFMVWGLLMILAPWLTFQWGMLIVLGGVIALVIGVYAYSYVLYKKEKREVK